MDEANLKAKRAEEKQNERDQIRVTDEADLKAKRVEEKQNERDQKRATDETNLKAKDILIFNTPWQTDDANANSPISVVSSTQFDPSNERKTEIPIVLLYDGVHFESSIPVSEEDVQETIDLVRNYTSGTYIIPESLKNNYKSKESLVNENRQNAQHDKPEKTRNDANMKSSENVFGKKKGSYTKEGDVSSDTSNEPKVKVKVKEMTPEQLQEYWRSKKQNKRDQKRAEANLEGEKKRSK